MTKVMTTFMPHSFSRIKFCTFPNKKRKSCIVDLRYTTGSNSNITSIPLVPPAPSPPSPVVVAEVVGV
ncbi:hypothetical protein M0804_004663 [Polistes exclamans]|nr:hypothetical protein M0804_004663 [Polistes exclamans]